MRRVLLALTCASVLACACAGAPAQVPRQEMLAIDVGQIHATLSSGDLLRHSSKRAVAVTGSPVYPGRSVQVTAVPLDALFTPGDVPEGMHLLFECKDGFAASIPASKVLPRKAGPSRAYIAVEDPASPWPPVEGRPDVRPGPFFLVWTDPEAGHVLTEEWPYQIQGIKVVPDPSSDLPKLNPAGSVPAGDPIRRGHDVFTSLCLPCHTLNGAGRSTLGPDLNLPMSPVEYFQAEILKRYLRDPRSVRAWPGQKMPAFAEDVLPEEDLTALEAYLRHMAETRRSHVP